MARTFGMYGNDEISGKGSCWDGMKPNDMRPKEDFKPGCKVDCIDRPALHNGKLHRIDCDNRLGLVEWPSGKTGWWYLKDLVIVGYPIFEKEHLTQRHREELFTKEQINERIADQIHLVMLVQAGL